MAPARPPGLAPPGRRPLVPRCAGAERAGGRPAGSPGRDRQALRARRSDHPRQDLLLTGIETAQRAEVVDVLRRHGVALADDLTRLPPGHGLPGPPHVRAGLGRGGTGGARRLEGSRPSWPAEGLGELDLHVRMTGCPNGCARPYTAEIGIVGRTKTGYDIHLGGAARRRPPRTGRGPQRQAGRPSGRARPVAGPLRAGALRGETFGDFVHQVQAP